MQNFDAWHLPGLNAADLALVTYRYGNLDVRAPQLTAPQLEGVIEHITRARETVRATPIGEIVTAIDAAARAIGQDRDARVLLREVTGYSQETIEDILDHMVRDWSRDSLETLLRAELEGASHPIGPRLAFHIFAGNVPGVSVTSVVRALLVRAATLGKTASGEPVLAVLFARALAQAAPHIAETLAITHWPGGTEAIEAVALRDADLIIVYGGADTVREVTARAPAGARIVVHGPKLSLGLVGRAA